MKPSHHVRRAIAGGDGCLVCSLRGEGVQRLLHRGRSTKEARLRNRLGS